MADLLIDTDVFVDHLTGAKPLDVKSHRIHCSVVTSAELFAGNTAAKRGAYFSLPFESM